MKKKKMALEIKQLRGEVEILHAGLNQLSEFLEIMMDEVQEFLLTKETREVLRKLLDEVQKLKIEVNHSVRRFPKLSADKTAKELQAGLRKLEQEEMNRHLINFFYGKEKDGSNGH